MRLWLVSLERQAITKRDYPDEYPAGVILSHRVGGPIYQLNKYIEDLLAEKVKPRNIAFRKNDFFHNLADNFNKLQKKYKILR